jgi:beta-mannosidase
MFQHFLTCITVAAACLGAVGCKTQSTKAHMIILSENWTFRQAGKGNWMSATVPGTVHTDLMANEKIPDPFFRTQEKDVQWVDKVDWEYQCEFEVDEKTLAHDAINLECLGLDTYADVYLNDKLVILADNFFVAWEKEVKKHLKVGKNRLRIFFHSPITVGLQKLKEHGYGLPATNDQSENGGLSDQKVSVFLRKPGYHFGWDWGPRLVTSGIYRPIRLRAWNKARLTDVYFQQVKVNADKAEIIAQCEVESKVAERAMIRIFHGDTLLATQTVDMLAGKNMFHLPFNIHDPKLWWTFELGEPYRYELRAELTYHGDPIDETSHKVGLRSIKIVQNEDPDGKGSSFYFELNGRPVFAKGANYIPNDIFIPRFTDQQYTKLVQTTVESNMNMLRIWGGGFYENEIFYDLCDEKGVLVWQDFMFACSMYPGDRAFIRNVEEEAIYNVKRLRNHPCIAIWCGNNEIDIAWAQYQEFWGWGWKQQYTFEQRKKIWKTYDEIFHKLLPTVVGAHHQDIFYWPSSPTEQPGVHSNNHSKRGDIHYWGVWHAEHPFSDYYTYVGRFMSEYGFQSFPEFRTVKTYATPEDWDIESPVMAAHQRSGIGNLRIRSYMQKYYQTPKNFEHLLYVGQVLQGEGIKMAVEAHRAAMPYCMGSLYWQINDCWPVASWSSTDYYQRWKAMQFFVKKAFSPLITTVQEKDSALLIKAVSDLVESKDAKLNLRLLDFNGKTLWSKSLDLKVKANTSTEALRLPIKDIISSDSTLAKQCVLVIDLQDDQHLFYQNLHYLSPVKNLQLPKGVIVEKLVAEKGGKYHIQLIASQLVKNIFLDFGEKVEGRFSDNYFDLLPGQVVNLEFYPDQPVKLSAEDLKLLSIADTY